MTSLLQPTYTLTLGAQRWSEQLLSLDATIAPAPLLDVVRARLPIAAPVKAAIGDPAQLTLHNGEKEADVFAGAITTVRRTLDAWEITALNAGGTLARFRPAATFEQITAGTLIRNLCDEVGAGVDTVDDGVALAFYTADPSRTAWEHIARVAAWSGALALVTNENSVAATVVNATVPELALRYGRELLAIEQAEEAAPVEAFVVAGESGAGDTGAPEALRPTTDFFAGSRPAGPNATRRWRYEPALRTAQAAGTAGAARDRTYRAGRRHGTFTAFLQPELRPGAVFEIQELPEGMQQGPHWVYHVRHRLDRAGARTCVRFYRGGDSFDPLALLGSLAGAIGGLL